jgi:Na+(H+)/acetate symporter ActP
VNEVRMSRFFTLVWGILAITVALSASLFENLIQLVNLLGSLFYGTILGIFLVAFFLKKIGGRPTLWAGVLGEIVVLTCHFLTVYEVIEIGYLWYNLIGCGGVILFAVLLNQIIPQKQRPKGQIQ